jgi:hypothetical protein
MTLSITRAQALTWRMGRQFLLDVRATTVEEVVRRLVAVPAWSGDAELAIGLRTASAAPEAVASAFSQGRVLKTFTFRGSMHYLVPGDVGTYLALRAMGRQWELRSWREFYNLEPNDWPDLRATVRDALSAKPLSQPELADAVATNRRFAHLRDAIADRSFTLIKPMAWQGDLSLGPLRDGKHTLQSLDGAPGWRGIPDIDESGPRAIVTYLDAYGPATPERLQYWLGAGLSVGRRHLARWTTQVQKDRVSSIAVDGRPMLCLTEHLDALTHTGPSEITSLLPGLDQWVLGPGTADEFVVPPERRAEITRGANIALRRGDIFGTWKTVDGDVVPVDFGGLTDPM